MTLQTEPRIEEMTWKRAELRVKIKSLATEAHIIRAEERKAVGDRRQSLHLHRTIDVRREARHALLAYAFLRHMPYRRVEVTTRCDKLPFDRPRPDWGRVATIVSNFSDIERGYQQAERRKRLLAIVRAWAKE